MNIKMIRITVKNKYFQTFCSFLQGILFIFTKLVGYPAIMKWELALFLLRGSGLVTLNFRQN